MNFKFLNNILGWAVFAIATITYFLTMEPTASFWDCGEFIACAYKLEVPHPSGAPLYLLIGRIFSLLAGSDTSKVAYWVNIVSVLTSGFSILFLFWTISLIGRKILKTTAEEINGSDTIKVLGASTIGALAYTFSDSFWFSAVEAEVYGISSFFTAIVVWAAFRWEIVKDPSTQNKWLIFIAYLVGLSIGVHLLNLVTIPGLAILYYFKKYDKPNFKGGFVAFMIGMCILGFIMVGLITGLPTISFAFDKLFVNTFGLGFGSGMIFFVVSLIGTMVYFIHKTQKEGKVTFNTVLVCFAFVLMGYSTYTIALIRSNYNPPINENNPSDVLNFTYYLKREQYGSRPLFYGPIYTSVPTDAEQGSAIYGKGKDKYEVVDYENNYIYGKKQKMLIPRLWSNDPSHKALYNQKLNLPEGSKVSFGDNMTFLIQHQFGHMYMRYFLWNFWGRSSDIFNTGPTNIFEAKNKLPEMFKNNKARTNFFALPLILGLLGLIYHFRKDQKGFFVTFLLFLFTGVGLVFYINSPPVEPRERDYIFVGSFYFFAIWIGLAVMALIEWVLKFISNTSVSGVAATAVCGVVPFLMAKEGWTSHDRSNRRHQVDFAKNMLNTCEKNAILFTGGDNDTFSLWYAQEVEGYRTDVRVCNLSLLGTEWYIEQMKRKTYQSEALPISLNLENYNKGINDYIEFYENPDPGIKAGINLKDYLYFVKTNNSGIKVPTQNGQSVNILPSENFYVEQDPEAIKKMAFVKPLYHNNISNRFQWNYGKRSIMKNDLIMLDIISNNNWKRPLYFAGNLSTDNYLNLKEYCQLEGYAYRLMPFRVEGARDGFIDTEILKSKIDKNMSFKGLDDENIYYDSETYLKLPLVTARFTFLRLIDQLVREGKNAEAEKYLDKCMTLMPDKSIPYDQITANFIIFYFEIGKNDKAKKIADVMLKRCQEEIDYFSRNQNTMQWNSIANEVISSNIRTLQLIANTTDQKDKVYSEKVKGLLQMYAPLIQ
ncbi:MAG: protein O-mannosyl-transferase family [Leadbetterella sp.]